MKNKQYWYINARGIPFPYKDTFSEATIKDLEAIGNKFESLEEASYMVERLKAWERLKNKGFRFNGHLQGIEGLIIKYECIIRDNINYDLDLLFKRDQE